VFASWKGEPEVERLLKKRPKKKGIIDPRPYDPDPHPLAYLNLEHFNKVGKELNEKHFRGDVAGYQTLR
jgi:hypothetical protein